MNLVIDTNILFSALIKDSITRKVLIKSGWKFHYPEMSFHEIHKYKMLVLEKSGMDEAEYTKLLSYLLVHVNIVSEGKTEQKLKEAKEILGKIDPDDVVFLATALALGKSAIWSDDKDFEKQNKVKVLKTKEIIEVFLSSKRNENSS